MENIREFFSAENGYKKMQKLILGTVYAGARQWLVTEIIPENPLERHRDFNVALAHCDKDGSFYVEESLSISGDYVFQTDCSFGNLEILVYKEEQ